MRTSKTDALATAQAIAAQFSQIPSVESVILGGSLATDKANENSDIDLYIYAKESISLASRASLIQTRSSHMQLNNTFWESEDYWIESCGIKVEAIYRGDWPVETLKDMFANNRAHMGFSTSIWHNIVSSKILFDRNSWYADLQKMASVPYPDTLAKAIIQKNFPLLKGSMANHLTQLEQAVKRNDHVHVINLLNMIFNSYFDILFAFNKTLHPGVKRQLEYAEQLPLKPENMKTDVLELSQNYHLENVAEQARQLIERLDLFLQFHKAV